MGVSGMDEEDEHDGSGGPEDDDVGKSKTKWNDDEELPEVEMGDEMELSQEK